MTKGRTTAACTASVSAVRAVVVEFEAVGVENASDVLRIGTVAMAQACLAAFRQQTVGVGWLVAAARAGGRWESVRAVADAAEVVPSRFAAYDVAAGL